jgi:hypothetical protein
MIIKERRYAEELVREFFYALPNNGYLHEGLNSVESRWQEARKCALIALTHIRQAAIAQHHKYDYDKVEQEINKLT